MELKSFLVWLTTPAAGVLAYLIIDNGGRLDALPPQWKRALAYILTAAIALSAWGVQIIFNYVPAPATWSQWIEVAFAIAMGAFGVSQFVHGARDLREHGVKVPCQ